jgi:hypothetical protein
MEENHGQCHNKKKAQHLPERQGVYENVSNDDLHELLIAWQNWSGSGSDFYRSLGFTAKQMNSLIGKAKNLKREGYFGEGEFKTVTVEGVVDSSSFRPPPGPCAAAEIVWNNGQVIRSSDVTILIKFLKKSA